MSKIVLAMRPDELYTEDGHRLSPTAWNRHEIPMPEVYAQERDSGSLVVIDAGDVKLEMGMPHAFQLITSIIDAWEHSKKEPS